MGVGEKINSDLGLGGGFGWVHQFLYHLQLASQDDTLMWQKKQR